MYFVLQIWMGLDRINQPTWLCQLGLITARDHRVGVLQKTVKVFPLHPYRAFTVFGYIRRLLPKIKDIGCVAGDSGIGILSSVHIQWMRHISCCQNIYSVKFRNLTAALIRQRIIQSIHHIPCLDGYRLFFNMSITHRGLDISVSQYLLDLIEVHPILN